MPTYRCTGVPKLLIATRRSEKEIGAEILLKIGQEFDKSIEWLLTGEGNALRRR